MYPNNGASPVDLQRFPKLALVLDVIYNPARTALLLQAEELGIPNLGGLHMLVAQAKRSSEIFTGTVIDDARIDEIESALSRRMRNIILIGMPGSGKSTLARMLGGTLHREVVDADEAIVRAAGMPIPEFFARYGEESFRRQETAVLRELGKRSGAVIATGGGCVTRPENYALLHQNGTILWLRRALDQLSVEGRPLSQRGPLEEMYAAREALYARFADISVDNDGDLEQTLQHMLDALGANGAQKNR
jgi:shikimate dehydrogenase